MTSNWFTWSKEVLMKNLKRICLQAGLNPFLFPKSQLLQCCFKSKSCFSISNLCIGFLDPEAGLAHYVSGGDSVHQWRPGGGHPQEALHWLDITIQICKGERWGNLWVPGNYQSYIRSHPLKEKIVNGPVLIKDATSFNGFYKWKTLFALGK